MKADRNRKREDFLRASGRGLTVTGADQAAMVEKVRSLHDRGMSYVQMGRQAGLSERTVRGVYGRTGMKRATYTALARLSLEEPDGNVWVDATGTRRRLAALWAEGYPLPFLVDALGAWNRQCMQKLLRGERGKAGVEYFNARAVAGLYDKLAGRDPVESGVDSRAARYARTFAAKKGYAPSGCWDPDTIDDPDAFPDWTGRCGTRFGYAVHKRESIPACTPCLQAYTGDPYPGFSGDLLRQLRERRGKSRRSLAAPLNLNAATIQYWESGRNKPSRQGKLDEVLSALDGTYEDVCEDTQ